MAPFRLSKRWRRIILFTWVFQKRKVGRSSLSLAVPNQVPKNNAVGSPIEPPPTTGICGRCAVIPWARLLEVRNRDPVLVLQDIYESKENLQGSDCRMCRMIGSIKRSDEDFNLKWTVSADQSLFVGKLTFAQESSISDHDSGLANPYLGVATNFVHKTQSFVSSHPSVDFELFKDWLKLCGEHNECHSDETAEVERLKVIDCEARSVQFAPEQCRFVALSYLWGPMGEDTHYHLPAKQPPTIEDSITVTLRLGFRYLWIDRYCIDQASAMDKHLQIKQMGQIYASAQLTIIAATGTDPTYGLPGVSRPRNNSQAWAESIGPVTLVQLMTSAASELQHSMWATRAWTFQEGILSKRRLIFTDQTALYICAADYLHDLAPDYNSGLNSELLALSQFLSCTRLPREISPSVSSSRFKEALRYLTAYSQRNLRITSDALNAIVGILNYMSNDRKEPVYHLWGVPLVHLVDVNTGSETEKTRAEYNNWKPVQKQGFYDFALNWVHMKPCRRRNGFPSWSPLGWDGPIEYPVRYMDIVIPKDFKVRVHRIHGSIEYSCLREELKRGHELQYEGRDAVSTTLEILFARVAPVQVSLKDGGIFIKSLEGIAFGTDCEVYWDTDFQADGGSSGVEEAGCNRNTPFMVWQIGCKTIKKRRYHYVLLRRREDGIYERIGFIIAVKGGSDAGLLRAGAWTDPIPCTEIDSFLVT